jgi:hypothetical protein
VCEGRAGSCFGSWQSLSSSRNGCLIRGLYVLPCSRSPPLYPHPQSHVGSTQEVSKLGVGIYLFSTASRLALGPTHPPIQWALKNLSLGVKRPHREADRSPPSSAEVKNAWCYTTTPPIYLHGIVFNYINYISKYVDTFAFICLFVQLFSGCYARTRTHTNHVHFQSRREEIENSSDIIGNRTRDLASCSMVPQPTALPQNKYQR